MNTRFFHRAARVAALAVTGVGFAVVAQASQITYAPVNPVFQPGNPLAGSTLLSVAEAQRKKESTSPTSLTSQSIAQTVQASFLARLTSDLYSQVFCAGVTGCQAAGSFDLGSGNLISFTRAGGNVTVTFTDPNNGTTVITVPDFAGTR